MANKHSTRKISRPPGATFDSEILKAAHAVDAESAKAIKKTRAYWNVLGPGLTTGASDDDPSGIATYSQTGAKYGYQLLWLAPLTFPLMSIIQEMCARIGIVTGRGLAGNIRLHFSKKILYLCTLSLFVANALNIGADLGAMVNAVQLLNHGVNYTAVLLGFGLLTVLLQIYLPYARYAHVLKWLAMILLAYVASALMAHIDWSTVLHKTVSPSLDWSKDQLLLICAILGTTISPYLFFWQTSQEVEEEIVKGKTSIEARRNEVSKHHIRSMRTDVWSGMLLSNLVMFFIIAACAATLFPQGITNIESASQAAEALRPFAGNASYWLFSLGIIGTGLLAIPVLACSSSYAVAESFKWKEGLYRQFRHAHAFYGIIILSILIGLGINFLGINPIKALIYSAVANGIVAPLILATIVIMSSRKSIMGPWVNNPLHKWLGWGVTGLMTIAGGAAIWSFF